ncbi:MAG: cyclic pyranopterin monophosphate synthase MoaC, partial [Acidobacteriota bacterium]|nr:cyclic pyranopterin monophosphate synthase MoaC [Acidobacteriota bacterium]
MVKLSHFDEEGKIRMVDIGGKEPTRRSAVATARVNLSKSTVAAVKSGANPKGDPLEIARIAGIMGAKKTSELIPLCHQIALSGVDVTAELDEKGVSLTATARTEAPTGVEMEALTAVSIAALTIYDMCKAIQKNIEISGVRLESKTGGKSNYQR